MTIWIVKYLNGTFKYIMTNGVICGTVESAHQILETQDLGFQLCYYVLLDILLDLSNPDFLNDRNWMF